MPVKAYQDWKRTNAAVGCMFARRMAARPSEFGQRADIVNGTDPTTIANAIATHADHHLNDPTASVLALVFPELTNLRTLVEVAHTLGTLPNWSVTTTKRDKTPVGPVLAFGIMRMIPFGTGACPSEALVLGPFKEFPNTRQAPVTALELFVGAPFPLDPKTKEPTQKANLAHVDVSPLAGASFDNVWLRSKNGRRKSLGISIRAEDVDELPPEDDDLRAKAKVAFVIPMTLAATWGLSV